MPHAILKIALISMVAWFATVEVLRAETIRVPRDFKTIQAAIEASKAGDTIMVAPGIYRERIRLKSEVTLRSEGGYSIGVEGFARAEKTIIDGSSEEVIAGRDHAKEPGIRMAFKSVLDGFTIINVGKFDEELWNKHYNSHGEELGDDEGAMEAEGTVPAILINQGECTVTNCMVHDNGDVGIGIVGVVKEIDTSEDRRRSEPPVRVTHNFVYRNMGGGIGVANQGEAVIRKNVCRENLRAGIGCRNSNPTIIENSCFGNVRAGIGCREGARPQLVRNICYKNRRAGIGIRMQGTTPIVTQNQCYENELAGIGCRDQASPIILNNSCCKNKLAGIGCRDGVDVQIIGNECSENGEAGIGLSGNASAMIEGNRCVENKKVAIGVTGSSQGMIVNNDLTRTDGVPPIIAIKDQSKATIQENRISGGGVAAILFEGTGEISNNELTGRGATQGNAIWIWKESNVRISDNHFDGYGSAIRADKATVSVVRNHIKNFQKTAISIKDCSGTSDVFENVAYVADVNVQPFELVGVDGEVRENQVKGID